MFWRKPSNSKAHLTLSEGLTLFYESMTGVLSPATVRFYQVHLASLVDYLGADCRLDSVTIDQLRAWRSGLCNKTKRHDTPNSRRPAADGGYSPFTLHQYVRSCKRFFKWLAEEEKLRSNPARRLELPLLPEQHPRGIPVDSRDAMIGCAANLRDLAIMMFLADTACRVAGVVNLRLCDLELDDCQAQVHEKGRGNRRDRTVYFSDETAQAIRDYLAVRPDIPDCDSVFVGNHNGRHSYGQPWGLTETGVREMLRRTARAANVKSRWNPHNWRHAAIRGMLSNGLSLPETAQIAGHSTVKVTGDTYGYFPEEQLRTRQRECSWLKPRKRKTSAGSRRRVIYYRIIKRS